MKDELRDSEGGGCMHVLNYLNSKQAFLEKKHAQQSFPR